MIISFEQPPFCLMTEERINYNLERLRKAERTEEVNRLINEAEYYLEQNDFLSEQPLLQISWFNSEKLEDFSLFNKVPFARPISPASIEKVLLAYNYSKNVQENYSVVLAETEDGFDRFYLAGKEPGFYFGAATPLKAFDENTSWYFPLPDEIALRILMYCDDLEIDINSGTETESFKQTFFISGLEKDSFYEWSGTGNKSCEPLNRLGVFLKEIGNPVIAGKYLKLLS